jgi:nucleotide-binding universal stress UspA family protein
MTAVWLRAALWLGLALAATLISIRLGHTPLTVVSVASPPEPPTEVGMQAAIDLATPHYAELFDNLRRQAQERHVTLEAYVLVGHPADQILKARYNPDMIVIGHIEDPPFGIGSRDRRRVGSSPTRLAPWWS